MTVSGIPAASGEDVVPLDITDAPHAVFHALLAARSEFGGKRIALIDGDGRAFSYDELVRASFALGHALKRGTHTGENVGVLLPTGAGAIIAFFALSAYGRVPAMLNFSAGEACLRAALKAARVKRIVTARRFVELGKCESLVAALGEHAEILHLEDLRADLSLADKTAALLGSIAPRMTAANPKRNAPAVILFTSGTEGEPKGVVLSHANLIANVEQVRAHLPLHPHTDILFNPLPTFHCFGLTVGALMPLLLGIKTVCHPTPLQPREIVSRILETKATILLSTDTFIAQYARIAEPGDLASLRLTVCGAERLRDETRALLRRKHGIELLEGYGVTETSPVVAANQPGANRHGTVGHLVKGMAMRLQPVEGIVGWPPAVPARAECDAGVYLSVTARRDRAAAWRLARHRRCRFGGRGRLYLHPGAAEALRQDRRRDRFAGHGGKLRQRGVAGLFPCRGRRAGWAQGRADRAHHRLPRGRAR